MKKRDWKKEKKKSIEFLTSSKFPPYFQHYDDAIIQVTYCLNLQRIVQIFRVILLEKFHSVILHWGFL